MFDPSDFSDESFSDELETDVASECGKCGQIEKITVFSKHPNGVVIVKFSTSYASQECVKLMDGRFFGGKKLRCYFWDGATDFTGESSVTVCLSVCLSVPVSVHVCLSVCASICSCLSVCLCQYLFMFARLCQYLFMSVCANICSCLSVCLCQYLFYVHSMFALLSQTQALLQYYSLIVTRNDSLFCFVSMCWLGFAMFNDVSCLCFLFLLHDFIPTHSHRTVVHGVDNEKEEEKQETSRLDEFGDWLDQDQEDLPEEFRLNVER